MTTKTIISFSIFLLLIAPVFGQIKNNKHSSKKMIDTTNVDYITITGGWTAHTKNKRLTKNQITLLADKWNSVLEIETIEPKIDFRIDIYLKKGKKIVLYGANRLISENGKVWYDLLETDWVNKLLE